MFYSNPAKSVRARPPSFIASLLVCRTMVRANGLAHPLSSLFPAHFLLLLADTCSMPWASLLVSNYYLFPPSSLPHSLPTQTSSLPLP